MKSNLIYLKKITAVIALTLFSFGYAQMTVKGVVKSADGFPEMGALVSTDGKQGVYTDADGKYSIKIQSEQASSGKFTLMVEGVSGTVARKSIKYKDGGVKSENFVLSAIALDEVVAVGYGSSKRRDLTGSIVSYKPDKDAAKMATSVDDLLKGKVAGVNVVSGGSTPGAAGSITIRGANSLTGDSQPLYVIDNVPQSSTGQTMRSASGDFQPTQDPLAGINPNDIEDIQILKDASATAIYGSRGANGVILITTKRGKMGKMNISLGSTFTVAQAYGLLDLMNLREYAEYYNTKHPDDPQFEIKDNTITYIYKDIDKVTKKEVEKRAVVTNRDWQREALRLGFSHEYNINLNGGTKKLRYNLSSSYKDVNGIVANTGLKHGDLRFNMTSDLTEKLTLNLNLSGFYRTNSMMSGGNTVGRSTGAIIPTALYTPPFVRPSDDSKLINDDDKVTVFSWITDYDDLSTEYRFSGAADLTYKFSPNLRYTVRAGGNINNLERQNWYGTQLYKGQMAPNGFYSESRLKRDNYNIDNLLFYNKSFDYVQVDGTAGVTFEGYKWLNTGLSAKDFPVNFLRVNGLHTASSLKIENPIQKDYQLLSYLGRLNLSFLNGRYVITGSFRADGTSKFKKGNRWGYFPSFAFAWNIKQENFLENADWLNQFKVRAGYGKTGSQNIDPYSSISMYSAGISYADTNGKLLNGFYIDQVNNPDLKWETTSSYNAGVDFDIFNGRLSGSFDIYKKNTYDLLLNVILPGSTSFNLFPVNKGELENKGIELALNSEIFRTKDFSWSIGGNIAKNKTKILNIGVPKGSIGNIKNTSFFLGGRISDHFGTPNIFIEGEAPGLFLGFKTNGIVQEGETYNVGTPFTVAEQSPGSLRVVDVNGDGKVDLADLTIIGDPNPDFTYGFQTSLKYKQVRFKMAFSGVKGGDIFNSQNRYRAMPFGNNNDGNLLKSAVHNAWTSTNKSNTQPAINSSVVNGYIYDRYLEDGSYLRCSDITLGFTFPKKVTEQVGLSNLDIFASVKNAFTITNYSGYDPASRSFALDPLKRGLDLWAFPMQRAYILGINIMF